MTHHQHPPQKRLLLTATVCTLLASSSTALHAETIDGVLEKGATWSSLFTVSGESGDSIGQIFRNQSALGKTILAHCLQGMPCQIEQGQRRPLEGQVPQKFSSQAMGWYDITAGRNPRMTSAISNTRQAVGTRQGPLVIAEDNTLRLRGKPILPHVQGNNFLSIVMDYSIGNQDVILLQNTGGSACPALYQFIIVQAGSVKATPEFGSCSDIIYPRWDGQHTITIDMLGYSGPMGSEKEQRQAAMSKETYRYAQGRVMFQGKEIK